MPLIFSPIWQKQSTVTLKRIIGNPTLKRLDPFLLFDYFKTRLPQGFIDHPHRGFETVTYMKSGKVYHEDFLGNRGVVGVGDLQWMTAGRGIIHAEMPASSQQDSIGFQLWLNLRSPQKNHPPSYQQYLQHDLPECTKNNTTVKLLCGQWNGHKSPIIPSNPSIYMDVRIGKEGKFQVGVERGWKSLVFFYEGDGEYIGDGNGGNGGDGGKYRVGCFQACVLDENTDKHVITSKNGASLMLIAGQPLNEPVWTRRLFVMNTKQQVDQAEQDYNQCKNGFENRANWVSKIQELAKGKKYQEL